MTLALSGLCARLAETAAGDDALAGDPLCVVGCKEGYDGGDVVDAACATEGSLRDEGLLEVGPDEACGLRAFGIDNAGVDGVDADLTRAKFLCEDASDGVECALGSGVDGAVGRGDAADARADVDDAGSFAEMLGRCLRGEENAEYVDVE